MEAWLSTRQYVEASTPTPSEASTRRTSSRQFQRVGIGLVRIARREPERTASLASRLARRYSWDINGDPVGKIAFGLMTVPAAHFARSQITRRRSSSVERLAR